MHWQINNRVHGQEYVSWELRLDQCGPGTVLMTRSDMMSPDRFGLPEISMPPQEEITRHFIVQGQTGTGMDETEAYGQTPVYGDEKFALEAIEFNDGDTTDAGVVRIGAESIA